MKARARKGAIFGTIMGLLFVISMISYAEQDGPGRGPGPGPRPEGGPGVYDGDRIIRMKDKLGLTEDQVNKIKALMESTGKNMEQLHKQVRDDMKALADKMDAKASDNELKSVLDNLNTDHQKIQDARKNVLEKMRAILTPTQQAKSILAFGKKARPCDDRKGPPRKGPDFDEDDDR